MVTYTERPDHELLALLHSYRPWTVTRPSASCAVSTLMHALRLATGGSWRSTTIVSVDGKHRIGPTQILRLSERAMGRQVRI